MKRMIIKNWMVALLLMGTCCGMVACDDDKNITLPDEPTAVVIGEYAGVMQIVESPSTDGFAEEPAGTALTANVTESEIQFTNFPIRDLVVKIIDNEELADQIVDAVGPIDYAVPYAALMNDDKTIIKLTLTPKPLTLVFEGSDEPATASRAEEDVEIIVAISSASEGDYTVESQKLQFALSIDGVTLGGVEFPEFQAFSLDFSLTKNNE